MKKSISTKTLVICIIVVFMATFGISFLLFHNSDEKINNVKTEITLEYGDSLNQLNLSDISSNRINLSSDGKAYQIIMYADKHCGTCIPKLSTFSRLSEILPQSKFECSIIWKETIPSDILEKYNIDSLNNYANTKMTILESTPTFFILDDSNTIIFKAVEMSDIIKKILTYDDISHDDLIDNANNYIINYYRNDDTIVDTSKPILIRFLMDGCHDCTEAQTILELPEIKNKYQHYNVHNHTSKSDTEIIDDEKIFEQVYSLKWYPSFEIINGDDNCQMIGEVPLEELKKLLS